MMVKTGNVWELPHYSPVMEKALMLSLLLMLGSIAVVGLPEVDSVLVLQRWCVGCGHSPPELQEQESTKGQQQHHG